MGGTGVSLKCGGAVTNPAGTPDLPRRIVTTDDLWWESRFAAGCIPVPVAVGEIPGVSLTQRRTAVWTRKVEPVRLLTTRAV
jgi:hypothetical protein